MAQHAPTEKTKPLSWVWSYFKPTEIAGFRYNVCHAPITPGSNELCLKRMIPDKSGGTKSMGNHLERKHRLSKSDPPPLTPITLSLAPFNHAAATASSSKRRLNRDSLIHGIARLVIACNLPVQIANNQQFIDLLHLCNPLITRSLLAEEPHLTLTRSIQHKYKLAKQALQSHLDQLSSCSFSLTATISTPSNRNHSVLALVLHWVSDQPQLSSVLLAITQLSRTPSSKNIALAIAKTLNEYDLQKRIFSLTIDNVPDLTQFGNDLAALVPKFKPQTQLIGCMARLINRAAEIALDGFQPSDHLDNMPSSSHVRIASISHQFNLRTIISRLQDLTLSLRQSAQKAESFHRIVAAVTNHESPHHPIAGLSINQSNSCWTSTYHVLSHAYQIKEAIQIFCLKESSFAQYHIHDQEWEQVRLVSDFLKPLNVAANVIATNKACDMITATPTYCWLLRRLNKVRRNHEGKEIPEPIKRMLELLNEFSERTHQNPVHIFGMILDPRIKMSNFEDQSPPITHSHLNETVNNHFMTLEEIRKAFYACSLPYSQHPIGKNIHNELHPTPTDQDQPQAVHVVMDSPQNNSENSKKRLRSTQQPHPTSYPSDSDSDSDYKAGQPRIFKKKPKLMIGLEDEITNYLEMECEESNCSPLEYWKLNANKFPSLSQMARDFLAIQSSTGLAFKATCKFNQLFESSFSSDSSIQDHKNLDLKPSSSPNHHHHHHPLIDSHFIYPTTKSFHQNPPSSSSATKFNPNQQRSHHPQMIPDHSAHSNNTGQSCSGTSSTTSQKLMVQSFPMLHPSPQTQLQQEFNHDHHAFPITASSSVSRRDQDILVDSRDHLTHSHIQEETLNTGHHHHHLPSIQDRIALDSSSNQHLILINRDRQDYIPTPSAALVIPNNSNSNNNNLSKHFIPSSNNTNISNNSNNITGSDASIGHDDGDGGSSFFIDKLDSFATLNSRFCQLCHIVCLFDWWFEHNFIQI